MELQDLSGLGVLTPGSGSEEILNRKIFTLIFWFVGGTFISFVKNADNFPPKVVLTLILGTFWISSFGLIKLHERKRGTEYFSLPSLKNFGDKNKNPLQVEFDKAMIGIVMGFGGLTSTYIRDQRLSLFSLA